MSPTFFKSSLWTQSVWRTRAIYQSRFILCSKWQRRKLSQKSLALFRLMKCIFLKENSIHNLWSPNLCSGTTTTLLLLPQLSTPITQIIYVNESAFTKLVEIYEKLSNFWLHVYENFCNKLTTKQVIDTCLCKYAKSTCNK